MSKLLNAIRKFHFDAGVCAYDDAHSLPLGFQVEASPTVWYHIVTTVTTCILLVCGGSYSG